jgi:hypothetical protein
MSDIYKGLKETPSGDLNEDQIALCSQVLQQYIAEDNLVSEEKTDDVLERLMKFAENFFQRQQEIMLKFDGDMEKLREWQRDITPALNEHAKNYQSLYQPIAHLAKPPYFLTPWVMAYMVDIAVKCHDVDGPQQYEQAPRSVKESIAYTIRFGENLLTQVYALK